MYNPAYFYQTRIRSVGVGAVIDENGRHLQVIGSLPINEGDFVWTDGKIAYGHRPTRQTVNLCLEQYGGIPVIGNLKNGYYALDGEFYEHEYKVPVMLNDNKYLYYTSVPYNNYDFLRRDEEIMEDDEGNNIGFYLAFEVLGQSADSEYVIYGSYYDSNLLMLNEGRRLIKRNSTIRVATETMGSSVASGPLAGYRFYTLTELAEFKLAENIAIQEELKKIYDSFNTGGYYDRAFYYAWIVNQLIDFRFTDRKGNWEMVLASHCSGVMYFIVDDSTGMAVNKIPLSEHPRVESTPTEETVEMLEYLGSIPIGDIQDGIYPAGMYRVRVTWKKTAKIVTDSEDEDNMNDASTRKVHAYAEVNPSYVVQKIKSDGTKEIVQKHISTQKAKYLPPTGNDDENDYYYITREERTFTSLVDYGWYGYCDDAIFVQEEVRIYNEEWIGSDEDDFLRIGMPTFIEGHGTAMYINRAYRSIADCESGIGEPISPEPPTNYEIKLGGGVAKTNTLGIYEVKDESGKVILDEYPQPKGHKAFWVEPTYGLGNNYSEPRRATYHYADGTTEYVENNTKEPKFVKDDDYITYKFPHLSIGKLSNGHLLSNAVGDGELCLIKDKQLTVLDDKSNNYRLNYSKRVKKLRR